MKKSEKNPKIRATKKMTSEVAKQGDGGGTRYNTGKTLVELVVPEWIWALADVTTRGSVVGGGQYPMRNWERGMKWSICIGCALRHFLKFLCGQRYDVETGCHHMAMAAWNLLAVMTYDLEEIGENDLPTKDFSILERVNSGIGTNNAEKPSTNTRRRNRR